MNDPAAVLFSYAMDKNIFPKYMENYAHFQLRRKANSDALDRLRAQLDDPSKKDLDRLMEEEYSLDSIHLEAACPAGLALGLQFLKLA